MYKHMYMLIFFSDTKPLWLQPRVNPLNAVQVSSWAPLPTAPPAQHWPTAYNTYRYTYKYNMYFYANISMCIYLHIYNLLIYV